MKHARNDETGDGPGFERNGCGGMVRTPGGMEGVLDPALGGTEGGLAVSGDSMAHKNVVVFGLVINRFRFSPEVYFGNALPELRGRSHDAEFFGVGVMAG